MGCRKKSYFLKFLYVDVDRDFVGVVLHVLLHGAKGSHNHSDCCCLSPHIRSTSNSKSLYLLSLSVVLTEVLVSRGIVMSMRSQVSCSLAQCPTRDGPVSVDGHVPQNVDVILLGDSLEFMLIPSLLHLNAKVFADPLVPTCCCLFVAVDKTRWSMVSSKRPQSLHFIIIIIIIISTISILIFQINVLLLNMQKKIVPKTGCRLHSKWLNSLFLKIKENPLWLKSAVSLS